MSTTIQSPFANDPTHFCSLATNNLPSTSPVLPLVGAGREMALLLKLHEVHDIHPDVMVQFSRLLTVKHRTPLEVMAFMCGGLPEGKEDLTGQLIHAHTAKMINSLQDIAGKNLSVMQIFGVDENLRTINGYNAKFTIPKQIYHPSIFPDDTQFLVFNHLFPPEIREQMIMANLEAKSMEDIHKLLPDATKHLAEKIIVSLLGDLDEMAKPGNDPKLILTPHSFAGLIVKCSENHLREYLRSEKNFDDNQIQNVFDKIRIVSLGYPGFTHVRSWSDPNPQPKIPCLYLVHAADMILLTHNHDLQSLILNCNPNAKATHYQLGAYSDIVILSPTIVLPAVDHNGGRLFNVFGHGLREIIEPILVNPDIFPWFGKFIRTGKISANDVVEVEEDSFHGMQRLAMTDQILASFQHQVILWESKGKSHPMMGGIRIT